ncbi:MAG: hypothetical protein L6R35_002378 [Caloplaca aegaea]|nr:MAG: hypothetical protein L6R35_002378 [Caloplaca aegaea]
MALRLALSPILAHPLQRAIANPLLRTSSLYMQHASIPIPISLFNTLALRLIALPSFLSDIWESILRAVPKKKTSHRKKRQRFLAGKALKDVTNLNRCSACGTVKRSHLLCPYCVQDGNKAGEIWAIALSADGQYLAATSIDGRINVWDNLGGSMKIREFETKGSFGMAIDLNGGVYIFNNDTGRLLHSLPGLIKPIRAVAFSPGCKLLAAAGDAKVIGLYDVASGEQVANLTGHGAWIFSLSWSDTGEYLLSGAFDGKAKVWSIDQRACVATHTETDKTLWSVKWLPKIGRSEGFATAGANRSISFYREATGG